MRGDYTTDMSAIWGGTEPRWRVEVLIADDAGLLHDWTDIFDDDFVISGDFGDSVDQPGPDLSLRFYYRRYYDNASPWVTDTRISGWLSEGRKIVVRAKLYCEGQTTAGRRLMLFDGLIDGVTLLDDNVGQLVARSEIVAELQDRWIEEEAIHGSEDGRDLDLVMRDLLASSTADASLVRLSVPSPPAFAITEYKQQPQSIYDAWKALVGLIGWDMRPKWSVALQAFRFVLYDPVRDQVVPDQTFYPEQWRCAPRAETKLDNVRNVISVWYTDGTTAGGQYKKTKIPDAIDAASVARYGRRWMEIGEGSTSLIDTQAEAEALAQAALADLAEPELDFDVEIAFFPWVEVNDLYEFRADGQRFGANQLLAVRAWRSKFGGGELSTTLQVSGKPSAGRINWLEREARPGLKRNVSFQLPQTPGAASAESSTEGAKIAWKWPRDGKADVVEVHAGDSASFTPDASSLLDTVRGASFLDRVTLPGEKRFYKLVTVDRDGNASPPTPAISATANFLTRDKLSPALRTAVGASMSGDQTITSGDAVDFDTLKFGDAGLLDTSTATIEPNYSGLAHVHVRVMPGASSEAVTWSLELRDGVTVLARTGLVDGDRALVISEVLELTGGEVLSVVVSYSGTGGTIEADGSVWSVVASQAGVPASTPTALHVNTTAPVLSGTPRVAQTVTVTDGVWSPSTLLTYSYQFRVGGENRGLTTSPSLALLGGDEGKFVDCLVVASHPTKGDVLAASNRLGPIEAQVNAPQVTSAPAITVEEA